MIKSASPCRDFEEFRPSPMGIESSVQYEKGVGRLKRRWMKIMDQQTGRTPKIIIQKMDRGVPRTIRRLLRHLSIEDLLHDACRLGGQDRTLVADPPSIYPTLSTER